MWQTVKCGRRIYHGLQKSVLQRRSFLSEAYRCQEAWNSRLQVPILQKVMPDDLFITLDHKYTTTGKVSALDLDIFANTVLKKFQVEELLSIVYNVRMTAETSNTLESTHHAVIRFLLDHDCIEELMNVLHDRLNYGIFPDHVSYNIMMDTFIKKNDYANAAKIAVLPMLQEDCENPITNALSIYCCHKLLEKPEDWPKPPVEKDNSKEEIKVRVNYLKNPYFDDHFDLTDPRDLIGKTLAFQGKFMDNALGRTCQLRGLILYKKYKNVSDLIKQWEKTAEDIVYEEVFNLIRKDNENLPEDQVTDEFKSVMSKLETLKVASLCKDSLTQALENNVKVAVDKQSETDIAEQLKKYTEWHTEREVVFNKQLQEVDKQTRIQNISEIKKDLQERERLLTFFEQEEDIDLEIERKQKAEKDEMDRLFMNPVMKKKWEWLQKYGDLYRSSALPKKPKAST